jgi:hypothetical protein
MKAAAKVYFTTPLGEDAAQAMEASAEGLRWHLKRGSRITDDQQPTSEN